MSDLTLVHLDCETYSRADLKTVGAHRYARDPSTECLMVAYAIDDPVFGQFPPVLWDCTANRMPLELRELFDDPAAMFVAFNASFEAAIFAHCLGVDLPPERWQCVQALALSYGFPGSLKGVGDAMGLAPDMAKKNGDKLIRRFCIPQKDDRRIMPGDDPAGWAEFSDYCKRDVVAECEIYRRLSE